ncbi:MAG: fimbrial biogenesis outer membrane usher protein [Alphaproteobacteria bacterium]|nr:fimbrial biogenesis outer membrane usher protein [Alphaproteobacteria bacterium]
MALARLVAVCGLLALGVVSARAEDALPPPGHLNDATAAPTSPDVPLAEDGMPQPGHLTDAGAPADVNVQPGALQLEVSINGYKVNMVAGFNRLPDGGLTSARSELKEIGLKAPGDGKDNDQVALSSIPGLTYSFDEAALTIDFTVEDKARIPKAYDILPKQDMFKADGGYGFVANYSAYAAANTLLTGISPSFSGASVNLDTRAYAPFGVLRQTGSVGTTTFADFAATRLDTTWTTSNQERAETYHAGDIISGGMNWSRPIRMGGFQAQRDFGIRPDLVTTPLANLKGTAAVPSTLDVYINGSKTFSEDVPQGPFEINRLPVISSQGTAELVLTDPSGQKTVMEQSVYSSPLLLAPKLFDYSVEVGFARMNYGVDSFNYEKELLAVVGGRYGFTKSLTGEFHVEAKQDLVDVGLGAVVQAGPFGTFNVAGAVSDYGGDIGYFGYGSWDWRNKSIMLHASSARTFGNFTDLAAATTIAAPVTPGMPLSPLVSGRMPKAVDQLGASYGFSDYDATVGLNAVRYVAADDTTSFIVSATASKSFNNKVSVFAAAYKDFAQADNYGFQVGFSMPLGGADKNISLSGSAIYDNNGPAAQLSAVKPMEAAYGSAGWRVNAVQNTDRNLSAAASYRAQQAIVSGSVENYNDMVRGNLRAEGSLIVAQPGVFLGNPVTDSFAVVDAGTEGVGIDFENRYIGKTGKNGKLLLTQVPSYRPSKVSVEPTTLPLNSNVTEVDRKVAPRAMSGAVVDFGVKKDTSSALVILKDALGAFVPPGTLVTLEGQKDPFPMGYDGQVYITGLAGTNTVSADVGGQSCKARFDYKESDTEQIVIGPLTCG